MFFCINIKAADSKICSKMLFCWNLEAVDSKKCSEYVLLEVESRGFQIT
jgi:hypothetical protein